MKPNSPVASGSHAHRLKTGRRKLRTPNQISTTTVLYTVSLSADNGGNTTPSEG